MTPVIGVGAGDNGTERHGPGVTGDVQGGAALATVDRTWPGLLAPFLDGFFEPSRRS